jgi:hypothetical protein
MPSTYSPSLRLELIGPGEQAGVWNTTTNTNLGTLLEASIAGNTPVSVTSANQALTATNGVTDQARQAILTLTTTTTAPFAVYAPPQPKQYIVFNTTAYAATIYNSTVLGNTIAAGTGVVIPAGKKLTVFSNTTSFFTTESIDLTGVLAVINGGTGVTSSTGAGSVVLSNSPALVTPALGTPASGILDNCVSNTEAFGNSTTQLATTEFVQAALQALHPVGSLYTSTVSTNPGTTFGFGTWVQFGAGRVLMGNGGAFGAGTTGGSNDATLVSHTHSGATAFEPPHVHTMIFEHNQADHGITGNIGDNGHLNATRTSGSMAPAGGHAHNLSINAAGVSGTNANLQPYIVVYMWNRTA